MIIVTGGSGFIGSAVIWSLNQSNKSNIIVVDQLSANNKWKNLVKLNFHDFIDKNDFIDLLSKNNPFNNSIECIIHMGACTSTTEVDSQYLIKNNYEYSKILLNYCLKNNIRFIYASSAATYGISNNIFHDDIENLEQLDPINAYAFSKHLFDLWIKKNNYFDKVVGLKFSNVYGPNENDKDNMSSYIYKSFHQIKKNSSVKLFKSNDKSYQDGEQKRDFIYVKDVVEIIKFLYQNKDINGLFNIGSSTAYSWNEMVSIVFKVMNKKINIEYIDMPENLINQYQNFTLLNTKKIQQLFPNKLHTLEQGITDYINNYLLPNKRLTN